MKIQKMEINMKKMFLIFIAVILFAGCIYKDPLGEIRRLARSSDIQKKIDASKDYKLAIDTLVKAYSSLGGLNKEIGQKLMFQKNYKGAIKHLEIAKDIRNDDANIYFWLGVCYVNLYKIENDQKYIDTAEDNYKTAMRLNPDQMDLLYSYAHLLVFGKKDYEKAKDLLVKYIYELNPGLKTPDPKAYFLLGRVYYELGDYIKAYDTYNELYRFEKQLTKEEKERLEEFIFTTRRMIEGE